MLYRDWVRRNFRMFIGLTLGLAALIVLESMVIRVALSAGPFRSYLMGATHTLLIGAWLVLPFLSFLAINQQGMNQFRGALGEDNTRDELKIARRRRLIWSSIDSVPFDQGDIDHLVITRRGGLVAIDSKWRTHQGDLPAMAADARRGKLRAEGLAHTLLERDRSAKHRSKGKPISVRAVVVVWGSLQQKVPADGVTYEGVEFVAGQNLRRWLQGLDGQPVPREAARDLVRRVSSYWDTVRAAEKERTRSHR
jgi:hypothetical protein